MDAERSDLDSLGKAHGGLILAQALAAAAQTSVGQQQPASPSRSAGALHISQPSSRCAHAAFAHMALPVNDPRALVDTSRRLIIKRRPDYLCRRERLAEALCEPHARDRLF